MTESGYWMEDESREVYANSANFFQDITGIEAGMIQGFFKKRR